MNEFFLENKNLRHKYLRLEMSTKLFSAINLPEGTENTTIDTYIN
jgi:hypothetical protein